MQTFALDLPVEGGNARRLLKQAHLLLQIVAIRTAPDSLRELLNSSNFTTRNAAYLHPDALRKLGLDPSPGVRVIKPCNHGSTACGQDVLIVCTPLLPPFGVIYGPLFDLFLDPKTQQPEDFQKNWNVAVLYPELWPPTANERALLTAIERRVGLPPHEK